MDIDPKMRFPKGLASPKKFTALSFLACAFFFNGQKKSYLTERYEKGTKKTSDVSLMSDRFFVASCHSNGCFERKHLLYISRAADREWTIYECQVF